MAQSLKVLFLAAEAEPYVKVGGLGDVAGSLPRALRALPEVVLGDYEIDVRLVLPFHSVVRSRAASVRPIPPFSLMRDGEDVLVETFEATLHGMPVYLIGGKPIDASGSVYSSNSELDGEKYTFFSLAALELPRQLGWAPDIVHANDWHTALSAYGVLVRHWSDKLPRPASLITVHNLPYHGPDVEKILDAYGLPLAQTDLPEWARLKPMPLGLWSADSIVAVSPTYADEMLSKEYGAGLHDFLATRRKALTGILNGIDIHSFDPANDPDIASQFTVATLSERTGNKFALLKKLELSTDMTVPVFGVVSRMDSQKGMDLVFDALKKMGDTGWQAVILGAGDPKLEEAGQKLQHDFPERVRVVTRYDAILARQIYAGTDIFLMPSRYEPCGLSQMIAMRYGCVPIVRAVGGLHDTVTEGDTGFVFLKPTVKDFSAAIQRALEAFKDHDVWQRMQRNGMAQDFSWTNSASQYFELYKKLLKKP